MFCPKCGTAGQGPNTYCKRCGEWLPDTRISSRLEFGGASPEQNITGMLVMSSLSALFALFAAAALYATHLGREGVNWSVYFAAGFCVTIALWQMSNFFIALKLRKRLRRGRQSAGGGQADNQMKSAPGEQQRALEAAATARFADVASVTENTTGLLERVPRRRPEREM